MTVHWTGYDLRRDHDGGLFAVTPCGAVSAVQASRAEGDVTCPECQAHMAEEVVRALNPRPQLEDQWRRLP